MHNSRPEGAANWLVTIAQFPLDDPAARMRSLRSLESLGAALVREGVYILPDTAQNREALEVLAKQLRKAAGVVHVLSVPASSADQHEAFKRLFDRSRRYDELVKTIESLRIGFGHSDPSAIARVLHKQRRDYEAIAALDFFPSEPRSRARQALERAEADVKKLFFTPVAHPLLGPDEALFGRIWATRKPLWADRLACAWLVRRFIDPEARLAWLEQADAVPQDAIGFAFDGAHFPMDGEHVAYEELLARAELAKNPALARIGSIVHFLELGGAPVAEAAGVETLLQGAVRRSQNDAELFEEAEKTFDLLYEAYYQPAKR